MASLPQLAPTAEVSAQRNIVRLDPADAPYTNAYEYLRAVHPEDLPQTIRDCLNNDLEMAHYIAPDLRTAEVRRPLEFKVGVNAGNFREFSTLRPWYNIHAAFVFITGDLSDPPCQYKVKGEIRTVACTTIFPRCVVPRADLNYNSGAKFNATACASHQYQCEGSKCVRGGVAQTKSQFAITQAQSIIAQTQHPAGPSTISQLQPLQAPGQVPLTHPGGPQHGSPQSLQDMYPYNHHVAHSSTAPAQYTPTQVQPYQNQSVGADPTQGYDTQGHGYESYNNAQDGHTATGHGPVGEYNAVPAHYSGQFMDAETLGRFQLLQSAAYTQSPSSQTVDPHALTAQDDPSSAYMNPTYPAQEHFVSPQLIHDPHGAQKLGETDMKYPTDPEMMDDPIFDELEAGILHDAAGMEAAQAWGSHEELHNNNNLQM